MNKVNENIEPIFQIITQDEFNGLRKSFNGARPHPLSALLGDLERPSQAATNTGKAAGYVISSDLTWIKGIKKRILDTTDPANAASALAELRAYGGLLEAGFKVSLVSGKDEPKPEFLIDPGDGREVVLEVHAKQIDGAMQEKLDRHRADTEAKLDKFREELQEKGKPGGVFINEPISITPFGEPNTDKDGDTITANAISRLCSIKAKERQLRGDVSNVLWLDLQDDYSWGLALEPEISQPVLSWCGGMTSGALWYALYGWKEAPIMESADTLGFHHKVVPMRHDGRFNQETKVTAVIAAFQKATVILEHPRPTIALSNCFRRTAMRLPWARAELSLCNWENSLVASLIEAERQLILAIAETVRNHWDDNYSE